MTLLHSFDTKILNWIRTYLHTTILDYIFPLITRLGNRGFIWIIVALCFLLSDIFRPDGLLLSCSLLLCLLIGNLILKPLIGRIRPCDFFHTDALLIKRPTDFSFPSGHTMSSFAAAAIILHADIPLGIIAYTLASLIAFSRLYLYVHYPSDIIAGILLGTLVSTTVILIL